MTRSEVAAAATSTDRTARHWLPLAVLASAQLMLVLDVTVVNVALPDIATSLRLSQVTVPWVMTTYTLLFGGLMLLGGRVADLARPRRATLAGLVTFTAASLLCGTADSGALLLTGRALQGIGAAIMSPAALATVMGIYTGPRRARALTIWSMISGVGAALGVILGGVLTSTAGWRWIFTINVPIGLALGIAIPRVAPARARSNPADRHLDVPGAVLTTLGTATLVYALINAGSHGWTHSATVAAFATAAVTFTVLVRAERRSADPLLRLDLLAHRPSLAGSFLMLVATGLMVGGYFLASFDLQHSHDYSSIRTGLLFLPVAVATVLGAHTAGQLLQRINARLIAVLSLGLASIGYALTATGTAAWHTVLGLAIATLGIGASFVTAFTAALSDAPTAEAGLRSALVNTFHELGGAAGVATLSTAAGAALIQIHPSSGAFRAAFITAAMISAGAAVLSARIVPAVLRDTAPRVQTGGRHG